MEQKKLGIVLFFDDNLGRGVIRLLDTGERLKISHRDIEDEGFVVLFEGELVEIEFREGGFKVKPLRDG